MSELRHEFTIPSSNILHVQIACCDRYIAVPSHINNSVALWSFKPFEEQKEVLELRSGHYRTITALIFNANSEPSFLCSCSSDYIILWNLEEAFDYTKCGRDARGRIIGEALGTVEWCSFSKYAPQVAVCIETEIYILSTSSKEIIAILEGHSATVTCAKFTIHNSTCLVSISVDRTFKVWDIEECSIVYQSNIISSSPLVSLEMDYHRLQFSLGTADGQVWTYDSSDLHHCYVTHFINVKKTFDEILNKPLPAYSSDKETTIITSKPSWQMSKLDQSAEELNENTVESSCSVLSMSFSSEKVSSLQAAESEPIMSSKSTVLEELICETSYLYVATPNGILKLNSNTFDVCDHTLFTDVNQTCQLESGRSSLLSASSIYFCSTNNLFVRCVVGRLFDDNIDIVSWTMPDLPEKLENEIVETPFVGSSKSLTVDRANHISVLSCDPVKPNSPLQAKFTRKQKNAGNKQTCGHSRHVSVVQDKPLTFKNKIKSSGYTSSPRLTMFNPDIGKSKKKHFEEGIKDISRCGSTHTDTTYMMLSHPSNNINKISASNTSVAINSICLSSTGRHLACALSDSSAQTRKLPLSGKSTTYINHNGSIDWVKWSHDSQRFITSSQDKTAALWDKDRSDPLLLIDREGHNMSNNSSNTNVKTMSNNEFASGVKFAQFYYLDQFILLVNGNTTYLFKYYISPEKDDVKRYLNRNHFQCVAKLSLKRAKCVTAFGAINEFYSYIVLAAGSNRGITVFDMNASSEVTCFEDVHSRPCHALSMNEGSSTASHPASAYDLFMTSAICDGIKMWDLRTKKCVQKFESHLNRSHHCGLSLSACGRFLATGTDDRSIYIYDVRAGNYLTKLIGHSGVVSAIQFHPNSTNLFAATLDGVIYEYGPNDL